MRGQIAHVSVSKKTRAMPHAPWQLFSHPCFIIDCFRWADNFSACWNSSDLVWSHLITSSPNYLWLVIMSSWNLGEDLSMGKPSKSFQNSSFYDRCPLGSGRHRVRLLDLLTFSYSPTRATRDIVVEGNELKELVEVKTLWKAILELSWVMPHSGFGATLKPDPLGKFDPPSNFFLQTLQIFSTKWSFGIPP